MLPSYPDQDVVVRGTDAVGLAKLVLEASGNHIKRVQLLSPGRDIDALSALPSSTAIDLCLTELGQSEVVSTWREQLRDREVRLVVPVVDGFSKVAKQALSANLPVALAIGQPTAKVVDELKDTFIFFVRDPEVKQPVDLFSRLLSSFLTRRGESLWRIQEEHPSWNRYVTDTGEVSLSARMASVDSGRDPSGLLAEHKLNLFVRKDECCTCRFFSHCEGYFKLPVQGYDCTGVKEVFGLVWDCAAELRTDLSQFSGPASTDF